MLRRLLQNLLLSAATLLLCVLLAEGALRLLHVYPSFSVPDRTVGFRFLPRARYRHTEEGFSEGRINAAGWRDRDYAIKKSAGVSRIVFFGDSFTEAFQVSLDSTFHKRLERDLNAHATPDHRCEALGLGRSGMGTTEEYLTYEKWGIDYQPDVVAVLFVLNDFTDNARAFDPQGDIRPYFVEAGDSLALDTTFVNSPGYRARAVINPWKVHSSLVSLATKTWNATRLRRDLARIGRETARDNVVIFFDRRVPDDSIPALRITGKVLARFAHAVQRDGRRFVLFVAGAAIQEDPAALRLAEQNPSFDRDKPQRFLQAVGRREGFEVVVLTPAFRAACAAGRGPLWCRTRAGYAHWNSAGHAVAAAAMERYLEPLLGEQQATR